MRFSSLSVIFLLLACCNTRNSEFGDTAMLGNEVIDLMVEEEMAVNFQVDTFVIDIRALSKKRTKPFTGLVYLLNTDCSLCISQFFDFLLFLKQKDITLPIVAIVEDGGTALVEFYMQQAELINWDKLEFIEDKDSDIAKEGIENYSGMVISMTESQPTGSVLYIKNRGS